jgi:glycosyltransferase involved in cell wall biosynthesis
MSLPRLLYVGDVPVEPTIAGAAVLYRLFDGYPADRLVICQSDHAVVRAPDRRLAGVTYHEFSVGNKRLLHSRVAGYYSAFLLARSGSRRIGGDAQLAGRPDAIVTVAHGHSWFTAATLARSYQIPLHLIVHDDCLTTLNVAPALRAFASSRFRHVYRTAATRFCISPEMRDHYFRLYGLTSDVLYPSKARDARVWQSPASRVSMQTSPFTVTFAGSLNVGHIPAVEALASALEELGGRLEIYGPEPAPQVRSRLTSRVVSFRPYLPSDQLAEQLRERSDLLWMPLSFADDDACNMRVCFPSKLTDYTIGVPILISGPADSAAVRWAMEHPGAAEVITDSSTAAFSAVLNRLLSDPGRRWTLAAEALRVGSLLFGHQRTQDRFVDAVVAATHA